MVRIAPSRCREILALIEGLAILKLEAEARRLIALKKARPNRDSDSENGDS